MTGKSNKFAYEKATDISAEKRAAVERNVAVSVPSVVFSDANSGKSVIGRDARTTTSAPAIFYAPKKKSALRRGLYAFVKRAFDIVSSLLAIIILSPVMLFGIIGKWIEDGHNPFYVSVRLTKNGKPFKLLKIRSMRIGADKEKDVLIAQGLNEADGPVFKMKNDPRITRFGRFLRKTSIDELPQLFNILKGDMSVVGPRPPLPNEAENYTSYQSHRLDVKSGLLCTWQVTPYRNSVSFEDWVKLDLEYIENQSIWLDIKIIFKAIGAVLRPKGAM